MRSIIYTCGVALALAGSALSLGCNVHDNSLVVDDPNVNFDTDVDTDNVEQGQEVTVHVEVDESIMVAPDDTPPAGEAKTAVFVQIHLDDTSSAPLLVTAEASATVTIPAETPPGKHKLICAVHKHDDGSPTGQEEIIEINVKASVSTGTDV
jgi:plastocyanin